MSRVNMQGDSRFLLMCAKMREIKERHSSTPIAVDNSASWINNRFLSMLERSEVCKQAIKDAKELIATASALVEQPVTKLEKAFEIYQRMAGTSTRKQIIQTIMLELDMTKAGAASYYGQARRKFDPAVDAQEFETVAA